MHELLTHSVRIAKDAGAAVKKIYETDFDITIKDDDSPLTEADLASHRIILSGLHKIAEYPVISEESANIDWEIRKTWKRYWLIDPLDGTKEFIKRNGEFTINIALIENGKPVLGVVYAPIMGRTYFAFEGYGAYRQDDEAPATPIRVCGEKVDDGWRIVGSRSHNSERVEEFMRFLGDVSLVSLGSSLKLCLVAEGAAHLYPRLGLTSEWDTAAAQCVLEAAGGKVLTDKLEPLRYNTKASLLNPHFIACYAHVQTWANFFIQNASE